MKKHLVGAILGIAAVTTTAFGQGHVIVSNYANAPYNQVFWAPSTPTVGNQAVRTAEVQLTLWYGLGTIADANLLTQGQSFTIELTGDSTAYNPDAGHGPGGYFNIIGVVPGWSSGPVTFQIRASGITQYGPVVESMSRSVLWTESNLANTASPAPNGTFSPGLMVVVPEPSSFALLGLGSAAMLLLRRKS